MNLLHVTDLGNGHVQVSWQRGKAIPRQYPRPIPFADPLTVESRSELRWYLEDFLQFPYGAERWRAEQIEKRMAEWGESLFKQVFAKADLDPDPRGLYQEAVREGLERCELCITSEDSAFLNIPWELIRDPTPGRGYLAPLLGGLYRHRSGQKIEVSPELSREEAFRILLVIARPYGERDIPLGTVARPVLRALGPLRPHIHLEVLRPPTFDALQKRLNARRGFYHLVHFDGHGVFARPSDGPLVQFRAIEGQGHLVFEKDDGSEDIINSQDLGQVLATCKVPLFVVNACQSAEEGKADPFSSVASQLVAIGAKGVVAMSHSVYATTAARFMQRFYEKLVEHSSLAEAVAAGRRRLYAQPDRESVLGTIELRDWMVPTLYQQEYHYVPIPEGIGVVAVEKDVEEVVLGRGAEEVFPEGRFGFIGRDYDILRIERALRDDSYPWVLLTGLGGTGKTELAFGFGRWYAETNGCPGGVFATSFKEKADFGQVIGSIIGYGTDFSRLPEEEQWQHLVDYLRENPCLLVLDNFETIAGYPESAEPLATVEEQAKLSRFLKALRDGKTRVLITTRKPDEEWLGIAYERIEVTGLRDRDAALMAKAILKTVGRRPEDFRDDPNYAELIKFLRGHPRSLEVVLPHLREKSPREVTDAIQYRIDRLAEAIEDASLGYAFLQMSSRTRRHLPFIGLFVSYVDVDLLRNLVAAGDQQGQTYADIMGEVLDTEGWEAVLHEAGRSGLIHRVVNGLYELHPTLSPFLRRQLLSMVGEGGLRRLDSEFMKFYAVWAAAYLQRLSAAEKHAAMAVAIEEANLLRALRLADMNEQWEIAHAIVHLLGEFYGLRGRTDEFRALRAGLLTRVSRGISADAARDRAELWMYLLGSEAIHALERNELAIAEAAYARILDYLLSLHDLAVEPAVASAYHHLGRVAYEWQHFEQAGEWFQKSLEICERLGLEQDAASDYHSLGIIAQEQQQFDEANQWYQKALEIYERWERQRDIAGTCHQLGRVAEERRQLGEAERWYRRAVEINESLGLERRAAPDYLHLGRVAYERQHFDEAEQWYRKALEIYERLGLEQGAGGACHQLGMVAHERRQFAEAEQWYRKALEIFEGRRLERHAAGSYHHLGLLAQERQQSDEAKQWYQKAVEIYERLGLERYAASSYHQLGIIAQKGQQFDEAEEWYHRALEIYERLGHPPLPVKTQVALGVLHWEQNHRDEAVSWLGGAFAIAAEHNMQVAGPILVALAGAMNAMGEEEFSVAWRQALEGQEPPLAMLREVLERLEEGSR